MSEPVPQLPDERTELFSADLFAVALAAGEEPTGLFRGAIKDIGLELERQFRANVPVTRLVRNHARAIDALLVTAWRRHLGREAGNAALVAVGGYGRGDLHPASDIDILLLLAESGNGPDQASIESFLTFLWDIGLEVGHSVRTVTECVQEAGKDVTVVTNLMEARLLDGPAELFDAMRQATARDAIWPSRAFFEAKLQEQRARYHKYNNTAYNLEPNVKEGPGGLRDLQMIGWVLKRHFGVDEFAALITNGILTMTECTSLMDAQAFLWKVRFALHIEAGRREDRLLFDHQRTLARDFGYEDDGRRLAVERFMKDYYRTITELSRLNEMLLGLFYEVILSGDQRRTDRIVNARFQVRNDHLEVRHSDTFRRYPFALLELFLIMQQNPDLKGVRASTIRLVRDHRHLIDAAFRRDIRNRSLFLEILKQPRGLTHELHRMHRYGILGEFIPAFGNIEGQMQHDLFHVFTVDEHTLFLVRNLRRFSVPEHAHEFPLCSNIFQRLPKPELIYLAGLFHDIGKGRGGDHSELGAEDALAFCLELGLSRYDANLVAWLVKSHLVMSVTAQRQDISDPEVIHRFALRVGDQVHLNYLYLLTVADVRATSPELWNSWKDALLKELYQATARALRQGLANPIDRAELLAETRTEAWGLLQDKTGAQARIEALWEDLGDDYLLRHSADEIAWHTRAIVESDGEDLPLVRVRQLTHRGGTEVFLYAPDRDYLFAAATRSLDQLHLTIMDARIITSRKGMALDTFIVLEENGEAITGKGREREICICLRESLNRLSGRPSPVKRRLHRHLKHFPIPPRVTFRPDQANQRTAMEVVTADRPGLLSQLAVAMATCEVRVQGAKIATFGERAEDIFFVSDHQDRPLNEALAAQLEHAVVESLSED